MAYHREPGIAGLTESDLDATSNRQELPSEQAPLSGLGQHDNLARTIEAEIIPRLMLAHRDRSRVPSDRAGRNQAFSGKDVEDFVGLLLAGAGDGADEAARSYVADGVSVEALILGLFGPAANRLGDMWTEDACDFVTVTLALGRLQQLVHELQDGSVGRAAKPEPSKNILLCAAPGESHTFGLLVVSEFLQQNGWSVTFEPNLGCVDDLLDLARVEDFAVIGITASCDKSIETLSACVQGIRSIPGREVSRILIGGGVFASCPERLSDIGADAYGRDAVEAVELAGQLFEEVRVARLQLAI